MNNSSRNQDSGEQHPPPFPNSEQSPDRDPGPPDEQGTHNPRRSRTHLPFLPEKLPEYKVFGPTSRHKTATYFDSRGRPNIATAQEIAPPQDFPFSLPTRWAVYYTYRLVKGNIIWPLNIQHNVVLYYLIGKRFRILLSDLLYLLLALALVAADFSLLAISPVNIFPFSFASSVATIIPGSVAIMMLTAFATKGLILKLTERRFAEELSLTRITHHEFNYALMMRLLAPGVVGVALFMLIELFLFTALFSVNEVQPNLLPLKSLQHHELVTVPYIGAIVFKGVAYLISLLVGFTTAYAAHFVNPEEEFTHNGKPMALRLLPLQTILIVCAISVGYSIISIMCFLFGFTLLFFATNMLLQRANICLRFFVLYNSRKGSRDFTGKNTHR
ncbi:MAG: hypothetical protein ACFCU1_00265 [Sumerlaeia bacterium]